MKTRMTEFGLGLSLENKKNGYHNYFETLNSPIPVGVYIFLVDTCFFSASNGRASLTQDSQNYPDLEIKLPHLG